MNSGLFSRQVEVSITHSDRVAKIKVIIILQNEINDMACVPGRCGEDVLIGSGVRFENITIRVHISGPNRPLASFDRFVVAR